jgi:NAD(P)-dependent dehydrogenase (short-subunit alcohol dehydrogenase family)
MKGKTVVITGGTSGIGEVAAQQLAQMGARIVLIARDKSRGGATLRRLQEIAPGIAHKVRYADLALIAEMKRVAAEISQSEPRIDVLINNAGAMFGSRQLTSDGLEDTFALNHMSYFVVTEGLLERLLALAPARVVNTASGAHRGARLDFEAKDFSAMKAYRRSKLCNILFTRELARRLHGTGVTANCVRPGFVATRFGDQSGGMISRVFRLAKLFAMSPKKGAETLQVPADSAIARSGGRQGRFVALGAQRRIGWSQGLTFADTTRCGLSRCLGRMRKWFVTPRPPQFACGADCRGDQAAGSATRFSGAPTRYWHRASRKIALRRLRASLSENRPGRGAGCR